MTRPRSVAGTERLALDAWEVATSEPGAVDAKGAHALAWAKAESFLRRDADARDVFFRARHRTAHEIGRFTMRLDGLATLADVYWNGEHVLGASNMFHAHAVDVTARVTGDDEVLVRCAALSPELKKKRPRPRWKTRLVADQGLRFVRTSLVGRVPAWSPPGVYVGPYRGATVERAESLVVTRATVRSSVRGDAGVVSAELVLESASGAPIEKVTLRVGDVEAALALRDDVARGELNVERPALWWPHTHGEPALYDVTATATVGGRAIAIDLGKTGFRTITERAGDGFGLVINGAAVFARGACWTPTEDVSGTLALVRRAGMNMVRVGGTMLYEGDAFFDACDALGILVWQDYMFANLDYPSGDPAFDESVRREATELCERVSHAPSLAVLCGGSEGEQQAAMMGVARGEWQAPLFSELLADVSRTLRPDVPYLPSTPTGGAMPFSADARVGHYFGVGGYLRPLEDARRAGVRFAAECLAFSNVPCDETIESLLADGESPPTHPKWKERVPRDAARGWDFDDVRDHYVRELFGVDPFALRYADVARYLALGRVTTGVVMAQTMGEWRSHGSTSAGALIWFLRDGWPGAGWGVIDALGRPKSAYFMLARALAPVALFASDEGLNGLELRAVNDTSRPVSGELRARFLRGGETAVADVRTSLSLPARGKASVRVDALLPHFVDSTYAYRFGPPAFDAVVATLADASGVRLAEALFLPGLLPSATRGDLGLVAEATPEREGSYALTLRSTKLALWVALDVRGYAPSDDFLHVVPGETRAITLRPTRPGAKLSGTVSALNGDSPVRIKIL